MEFYTKVRSTEFTFYASPANATGLLIIYETKPWEAALVVFKTKNLTRTQFKLTKPTPFPNPNAYKACIFYSHYMPKFLTKGSQTLARKINFIDGIGASIKLPKRFNPGVLDILPMTKCLKHGNMGFLPLDFVRKLPEYTCSIHQYPVYKAVHIFEDCILQLPHNPPIGSSGKPSGGDFTGKCSECFAKLENDKEAYLYRDYMFCSDGCRYRAKITNYWFEKVMMALDKYLESEDEMGSMDKNPVFYIEP